MFLTVVDNMCENFRSLTSSKALNYEYSAGCQVVLWYGLGRISFLSFMLGLVVLEVVAVQVLKDISCSGL